VSRYTVDEVIKILSRVRAAQKPRVPLTEAEEDDKLLYDAMCCAVCCQPVPTRTGVLWTLCPTGDGERLTQARRFLLHTDCASRVQAAHPHATLPELVQAAREMRGAE
jgi:hypothetical protein